MLVEFTVANYKSFLEPATLSLVATRLTSRDKEMDADHVFEAAGGLRLLRSTGIYGANGSGKSNLRAALQFMKSFVLDSSRESQGDEPIGVSPFRLTVASEALPSSFEIVFVTEGVRYRYGFEATTERVVSEWLYHVPSSREALLFTRSGDDFEIRGGFREGQGLQERTRPNALFISVCAQFNGTVSTRIRHWFRFGLAIIAGVQDDHVREYTMTCFESGEHLPAIRRLLLSLDLGFDDIALGPEPVVEASIPENTPESLRRFLLERAKREKRPVLTRHARYDSERTSPAGFEWFELDDEESEGTRKLFALSGAISDALEHGVTVVIDEFEARLHPLITRAIIQLFNSRTTNPQNAQLIFITHDTNLLSLRWLRRDQIWFVEKDRMGGSHLYSLAEFQVRNDDASIEADYIQGRFGAIPFLGGLKQLAEPADATA